MKPGDPYIIQQMALNTYKAKVPSELEALLRGLHIIESLSPETSNDPETLGITGAIRKRIWVATHDRVQLDMAIRYYGRGFEVRRDYYNGENLATCFDLRAATQTETAEAQYDRMSAQKIRASLIEILTTLRESTSFSERSDRRWVFATLANCSFALARTADGETYERSFFAEGPAQWELETYLAGKAALLRIPLNEQ